MPRSKIIAGEPGEKLRLVDGSTSSGGERDLVSEYDGNASNDTINNPCANLDFTSIKTDNTSQSVS